MKSVLISLLFILIPTFLTAQTDSEIIIYDGQKGVYYVKYWSNIDTMFYTIPLFPGNKIDPKLRAKVINTDSTGLRFEYYLSNSSSSLRELFKIELSIDTRISDLKAPNREWSSQYQKGIRSIKWANIYSQSEVLGILPGHEVREPFSFTSTGLPIPTLSSIASYSALGNTRDSGPTGKLRAKVDSILINESHIILPTLGPWLPDSSLSFIDFTDTLETFRFRSCEELDWATDAGVCGELQDYLSEVKTALEMEDSLSAANALAEFIALVEAEKNASLTSEGYALLYFNAEYLADRLTKPK